jgi:hypothetical protein
MPHVKEEQMRDRIVEGFYYDCMRTRRTPLHGGRSVRFTVTRACEPIDYKCTMGDRDHPVGSQLGRRGEA